MSAAPNRKQTALLISDIKSADQDYEWYPSTREQLELIRADIDKKEDEYSYQHSTPSVLDIGCGDGRALEILTEGERFGIEKSKPLINAMDRSISIVGTDFEHQTLIDKSVDYIFCNPPYSEYNEWMAKILREGNCRYIYMIIPRRWRKDWELGGLIKTRKADVTSLGEFDFLTADRAARAKVEIICIQMSHSCSYDPKVSPFDLWFESEFSIDIGKESSSKFDCWSGASKESKQDKINAELVKGHDIVSALEELYLHDLSVLMENYRAIEKLDPSILDELGVDTGGLKSALRLRVEGLKDLYWKELFDNLGKITSRLSVSSRKTMLDKIMKFVHVDFTASNAHAVLVYVIKNANQYFDDQLVDLVERITEQASVTLYKSNARVYKDGDWRYCRRPDDLERYGLEYRVVLHSSGGLSNSMWDHDNAVHNGLRETAYNLLSDIATVAANLNFDTEKCAPIKDFTFESNKAVNFEHYDHRQNKAKILMNVRAFKNGNMHIKFDQNFIKRLNVEFGRLKGWLNNPEHAYSELDVGIEQARMSFGANAQLGSDSPVLLLGQAPRNKAA